MKRFHDPRVVPLEIWHGLIGPHQLYEMQAHELYKALVDFCLQVYRGQAKTASVQDTSELLKALGFKTLILCGGRAAECEANFQKTFLPFKIEICDQWQQYSAWPGSQKISEKLNWKNPLCIDWGQGSIKVAFQNFRMTIERDQMVFPVQQPGDRIHSNCKELRNFLQSVVDQARLHSGKDFDGLCLGLPVQLDSDGFAGPCSYAGLQGQISEIFEGLSIPSTVILNDAELAGFNFVNRPEKTLVVTVGTYLGAALCRPM